MGPMRLMGDVIMTFFLTQQYPWFAKTTMQHYTKHNLLRYPFRQGSVPAASSAPLQSPLECSTKKALGVLGIVGRGAEVEGVRCFRLQL